MKLTPAQLWTLQVLAGASEAVRLHGRTRDGTDPRVHPRVAQVLIDRGLAAWATGPMRLEVYATITPAGRRYLQQRQA